jgi:hypothetical protein
MPIPKLNDLPALVRRADWGIPLLIAAFWSLVCLIQIGAGLADNKVATEGGWGLLVARTLLANLPFAAYCLIQHGVFVRTEMSALTGRRIANHLMASSALCFVPLVAFEAAVNPIMLGSESWGRLAFHLKSYPALFWTFDFLVFAGCFAALLAGHLWQVKQEAERAHAAAENENLTLRLSLEQQRMQILQAQLEPHFMFNALNAISALVRGQESRAALTAIGRLSALLRYAVASSQASRMTLGDELAFITDYVELQRLRFDERLRVDLPALTSELTDVMVPPFLLQPLLENAIRHDIERHALPSRIAVEIFDQRSRIRIRVSNSLQRNAPPNPGNGIGFSNLRARLSLAYEEQAEMDVCAADDEFTVILDLPKDMP